MIENEHVTNPFILPLFANGTPTLLFSTAPGLLGQTEYYAKLFGQTVQPRELQIQANFRLVAYFLQPYALGGLFNISAGEMTDQPVSLALIPGGSDLQERLLNACSTDQLLQLIDDYLYRKMVGIKYQDKRITYATEKIAANSGKNILVSVQRELHLTERTFQRMFELHVGVSPNMFRRITQFNKAFRQVNSGTVQTLGTMAWSNGYADQSHFIRAFKEFTHLTPSAYLNLQPDC
jgi:AraC-like DNA-binding protein